MAWPDKAASSMILRGILNMHLQWYSKAGAESVSVNTSKASGGGGTLSQLKMRPNGN